MSTAVNINDRLVRSPRPELAMNHSTGKVFPYLCWKRREWRAEQPGEIILDLASKN